MKPKINTFIFDCFGVICRQVYYSWYRDNRLNKGHADPDVLSIFKKFDLGIMSEDDMIDYFLSYEGISVTRDELKKQIDTYLDIDMKLVKFIQNLQTRGFKIALLSNANISFFERKLYPTYPVFKTLFDEMIISSEVGMVKPDREIYGYTLRKLNCQPNESLFIDDNKDNIDMAVSLGMTGFLYTDFDSFKEYIEGLKIID
jgi:HAD superfamily hydrolase (TIGR01509 family)